jgi:hypothetical protein
MGGGGGSYKDSNGGRGNRETFWTKSSFVSETKVNINVFVAFNFALINYEHHYSH